METKISKIEEFLNSLEKQELEEQQTSMVLRGSTPNDKDHGAVNNCGEGVNCVDGCGGSSTTNGIC